MDRDRTEGLVALVTAISIMVANFHLAPDTKTQTRAYLVVAIILIVICSFVYLD